MIRDMESFTVHTPEKNEEIKKFYDLDEFYLQHLSKLGLDDKGDIIQKDTPPAPEHDDANDLIDIIN
jgi:hypothetical protein